MPARPWPIVATMPTATTSKTGQGRYFEGTISYRCQVLDSNRTSIRCRSLSDVRLKLSARQSRLADSRGVRCLLPDTSHHWTIVINLPLLGGSQITRKPGAFAQQFAATARSPACHSDAVRQRSSEIRSQYFTITVNRTGSRSQQCHSLNQNV